MTSTLTTAETTTTAFATTVGTNPSSAPAQLAAHPPAPGRTSERVDFRSASARLRENAGINDTAAVAAVTSVAAVGAAARRLRASNTFAEPTQAGIGRRDHPSFAPPVIAPVLVPVVEPLATAPAVAGEPAEAPLDAEEPIVIDLPACEVIYLDPQIGRRKLAAHSDRELRRASLAHRAAELLATIEDAKRKLVLT